MRFFQATRLFGTSVLSIGELFFACASLSRFCLSGLSTVRSLRLSAHPWSLRPNPPRFGMTDFE